MSDYKLISVTKSEKKGKKYDAKFENKKNKRTKTVSFGADGMDDYTKTKDKEQRKRYRTRHKKDLETKNPTRSGFLAWYILWNKPTLKASIADYKKRFGL
jgi:hypothetical protein